MWLCSSINSAMHSKVAPGANLEIFPAGLLLHTSSSNIGSKTATSLSQVLPVFDTSRRYVTVSSASVRYVLLPLEAVIEVTFFTMAISDCRAKTVVHDPVAWTSVGGGAGEDETTEAVSVIAPSSISTCNIPDVSAKKTILLVSSLFF